MSKMYHGSNFLITEKLSPKISFDYKPLVYATDDYFYALVRAGSFYSDKFLLKEDYNGKDTFFRLIELVPDAFKECFNTSGYIYEVNTSSFIQNATLEYVSEKPVEIISCTKIDNVWSEILKHKDHYELIFHADSEPYWKTVRGGKEGYLERRRKRLEKLKNIRNSSTK